VSFLENPFFGANFFQEDPPSFYGGDPFDPVYDPLHPYYAEGVDYVDENGFPVPPPAAHEQARHHQHKGGADRTKGARNPNKGAYSGGKGGARGKGVGKKKDASKKPGGPSGYGATGSAGSHIHEDAFI